MTVSSCTAGMHLVWFTLGLGPGDEVIVPAQTHVATAHAVELTGAKAVFVDAEPVTGNIDIAAIAGAITPRTKAVVISSEPHLSGTSFGKPRRAVYGRKIAIAAPSDSTMRTRSSITG